MIGSYRVDRRARRRAYSQLGTAAVAGQLGEPMDEYEHLRESADSAMSGDVIDPPRDLARAIASGELDAVTAIRTIARMLIDRRELSARGAREAREIAKRNGYEYSLNAEQMEGSHAAYSVACSIVAGACGVPSIDVLAADDPTPDPATLLYADDVIVSDLDSFYAPISERKGIV